MKIKGLDGRVEINNGVKMPYFGLGVFLSEDGKEVINAVTWALEQGYRHIDTASYYKNEEGVGEAIKNSAVDREDIFLVSKVWNSDQGYQGTINSFNQSLKKLQTEYLDLYLIHWPVKHKYMETWRALEDLYRDGRIKAIGVSNFKEHHLEDIINHFDVVPMVNQVEFHPFLVQQSLLEYCQSRQVRLEAWAPLMKGRVLEVELLNELAAKFGKTAVHITLRWNLQKGIVTIPKSVNRERIISNSEIFDFELREEDIRKIDGLNRNERIGPDPDHVDF